jgi:hypothetical protein
MAGVFGMQIACGKNITGFYILHALAPDKVPWPAAIAA